MSRAIAWAGAAIALAGGDKLAGQSGYNRMFRELGWSQRAMQAAAAAETVGGLLMMPRTTRRFGGLVVAGVSAILLASELEHHDAKLAAPRGLVFLTGVITLLAPKRRPAR